MQCRANVQPSVGRWMDGWMNGWMDGWMDGWIKRKAADWLYQGEKVNYLAYYYLILVDQLLAGQ